MNKNCGLLLCAYMISSLGDWLYKLAIPLLVYQLTGSALSMSIAYALAFVPFLLISPIGGVIADNFAKQKVIILLDGFAFVVVLAIAFMVNLSFPGKLYCIYSLICLGACTLPIYHPTFQSLLPCITRKEYLGKANALISSIDNVTMLAAPIIGGVIIAWLGVLPAIILNSVSFLISAILILFINYKQKTEKQQKLHLVKQISSGVSYVLSVPLLKYGALLFFGTNFALNLLYANLFYYLNHVLAFSIEWIGLIYAISGMGAIAGSLLAPRMFNYFCVGKLITVYTLLSGICTLLLLVVGHPVLIAIIWGCVLLFGSANVVTYFTLRQHIVPIEYLGRVIAITRLIAFSAIPIGSVVGGMLMHNNFITLVILLCAVLRVAMGIMSLYSPLWKSKLTISSVADH